MVDSEAPGFCFTPLRRAANMSVLGSRDPGPLLVLESVLWWASDMENTSLPTMDGCRDTAEANHSGARDSQPSYSGLISRQVVEPGGWRPEPTTKPIQRPHSGRYQGPEIGRAEGKTTG